MSVFVAIDLDGPARAVAAAAIEQHRSSVEAKWQQADKLHLTLVFLGNTMPDLTKVETLAARARPFSLELRGAGVFVTERAAAVLWLGVGGDLDALHALHRDAAAQLGDEPRPYVPHVTLGRAQVPGACDATAAALAELRSPRFTVQHLTLYESTHHQFRALQRYGFGP